MAAISPYRMIFWLNLTPSSHCRQTYRSCAADFLYTRPKHFYFFIFIIPIKVTILSWGNPQIRQ